MHITSSAFKEGGNIPRKYTCQGVDINPPLQFSGVPKGAKSLALIMDDPDVPKRIREDELWVHWVVFNIAPTVTDVPEGQSPGGVTGQHTDGENCYMGPCPPDREHRYYFKLYALDCHLPLSEGATKEQVLAAMEGHILDQAILMGRYNKS